MHPSGAPTANPWPSSARSTRSAPPGYLFDEACNQKATDDAAAAPTNALIFDSLLYRHWNTYQGAKRSHILMLHVGRAGYIYDLTPTADWGENVIAPTFSLGGASGYAWAPDSKELAFVLNNDKVPAASTNNDIYTIDIKQHDGDANDLGKGWSPKKDLHLTRLGRCSRLLPRRQIPRLPLPRPAPDTNPTASG